MLESDSAPTPSPPLQPCRMPSRHPQDSVTWFNMDDNYRSDLLRAQALVNNRDNEQHSYMQPSTMSHGVVHTGVGPLQYRLNLLMLRRPLSSMAFMAVNPLHTQIAVHMLLEAQHLRTVCEAHNTYDR